MAPDEDTEREEHESPTGEGNEEEKRGEREHEKSESDERRSHEERPHPPAGPARYEGKRHSGDEYERAPERSSYRGRYGSRVQNREGEEREMSARERRERELREAREMREANEEEEPSAKSHENDTGRISETAEIPKYGGPRDPNWERQRQQAKQRHRGRDEGEKRDERLANAALTRQRDVRVEKGGRRYHRGRR